VFDFLKSEAPAWELVNSRQTEARLLALISGAEQEIWLVSPYHTLAKLGTLRRALALALDKGVEVSIVVRDEKAISQEAVEACDELLEKGLKLYAVHRLHAKMYWSERQALLTSANLVDGSFEESIEFGLAIPSGELHARVRDFIENAVMPRKSLGARRSAISRPVSASKPREGFCIRCGTGIRFNPARPYCEPDFEVWSQYADENYKDKRCHCCGRPHKATKRQPQCQDCWALNTR
jgi:phosphatidylserine/phosphatidylglycerophosphate/cardiolipin synthase-like enzyme